MSRCARCGAADCEWQRYLQQVDHQDGLRDTFNVDTVACRDRELANLRSLLRSVTGKLEEAAELNEAGEPEASMARIMAALEALS